MASNLIKLKWARTQTAEYPKIWRRFAARDLNSDKLVEYRIQDLPESRFEDAVKHMIANYLKDEPMTNTLSNAFGN